jgi:ubiquinone biosynthesis monooxygenase Coq7
MRINHSGEVAAQALYAGQALTAQGAGTQGSMIAAAQEETDHLAWCAARIDELGGRKSALNPLWYVGSFAIGALAGLRGDSTSLGFVAETEKQVGKHLDTHLNQLPKVDARSRAILEQMSADEAGHGQHAKQAGGEELPSIIRTLMQFASKVMTRAAYWI